MKSASESKVRDTDRDGGWDVSEKFDAIVSYESHPPEWVGQTFDLFKFLGACWLWALRSEIEFRFQFLSTPRVMVEKTNKFRGDHD